MALMVLSRVPCTWHNADCYGPVCQCDWIVLATTRRSLPEDDIAESLVALVYLFQHFLLQGSWGDQAIFVQ